MYKIVLFSTVILTLSQPVAMAKTQATWVSKDYKEKFATGFIASNYWRLRGNFQSTIQSGQSLPAHWDWRQQGTISSIKHQGRCASSWAFSTARTLQDVSTLIGEPINVSEQYLISCNSNGWGCNGGKFAHDYHMPPKGGVDENEFPYVAQKTECKPGLNFKYPLESWSYLSAGVNGIPSITEIKSAIYNYGPISVAVAITNAFQSYSYGIFNTCDNTTVNHAVNLIGWDDAGQYWIMANSWGVNWGENGFMRIKWNCNKIGWAANYVKYKKSPNPNPGPDPTPPPTPPPIPVTAPCILVETGPDIYARRGSTLEIGTPPVDGVAYQWFKNRVAIDGWNMSQLQIQLGNVVGVIYLELVGATPNGCIDSDKLRIFVR
jgi:C1A family cysteine protease